MKSLITMLVATVLLTGCASSSKLQSSSLTAQQAVTVDTRDRNGISLANASCELANDKGTWKTTTPGSVLIDRSLSTLSVSCVKDNMAGLAVYTPGMQPQACKGGEDCGYPALLTVEMKSMDSRGMPLDSVTQNNANKIPRASKIKVTGYGAPLRDESMSAGQRRLLALRASKADAYRALTEQVYGVRISGTTTVSDMAIKNDTFRVYVDAYVHGAQMLNSMAQPDGVYETEMELALGPDFFAKFISGAGCEAQGGVGPGCAYPNRTFYLAP